MHQPELLLLDEPTAGLDPLVQQTVLELVAEARQAGATVFFSSHILSEVQALTDRVGIIRQGELVEVANTADLLQRSLRRLRLRFAAAVDPAELLKVPGVTLLAQPAPDSLVLEVTGSVDALVKALGAYPLQDIETERPSLEEVFLAYYREQDAATGKRGAGCVSIRFFDTTCAAGAQPSSPGALRCSSWQPTWSRCMMPSSRSRRST